ncbi:DUF4214 domain-containing protein [Mycobacterium sp. KBS0706]|uniref:DUF4214 domain-containing protein n=1 Tax=Mycobacterium sp. KBS0706 TaxID=2578109 RepID=UPI00110FC607|nr:DUF4214 domain-containing protein [Mycobacterium sp. KBS0706]TSD84123.1 DUF4214 domain-containing protein [Mycobacterium sp. KBS0706]
MASPAQSPSVDEIINRVNVEAERRRRQPPVALTEAGGAVPLHSGAASAWPPAAAAPQAFPVKKKYALDEFLRLGDEAFVRAAYQGLLRREPDPQGLSRQLRRLRSGRASKADILISLRWSPEGRKHGAKVSGLKRLRRWRSAGRVPILGPTMRWLLMLGRLPRLWREVRRQSAQSEQMSLSWQNFAGLLQQRGQSHEDQVLALRDRIEELQAASASAISDLQRQNAEIRRQFKVLADANSSGRQESKDGD